MALARQRPQFPLILIAGIDHQRPQLRTGPRAMRLTRIAGPDHHYFTERAVLWTCSRSAPLMSVWYPRPSRYSRSATTFPFNGFTPQIQNPQFKILNSQFAPIFHTPLSRKAGMV